MGLFNKAKEKWNDTKNKWNDRNQAKTDKVAAKREFKIDKLEGQEQKSYAVAAKRKWLAIIMGLALVIYFTIFKGGFSFGGVGSALKGLF
tara:strand:+ start:2560 stop:2829 length:270 start_codon:yes stop_codon:yes gene_type:complete